MNQDMLLEEDDCNKLDLLLETFWVCYHPYLETSYSVYLSRVRHICLRYLTLNTRSSLPRYLRYRQVRPSGR